MAATARWVKDTTRWERTRTACPAGETHRTSRVSVPARRSRSTPWSTSNNVSCPALADQATLNTTLSVRDKDGGTTEYTAGVNVVALPQAPQTITFDELGGTTYGYGAVSLGATAAAGRLGSAAGTSGACGTCAGAAAGACCDTGSGSVGGPAACRERRGSPPPARSPPQHPEYL